MDLHELKCLTSTDFDSFSPRVDPEQRYTASRLDQGGNYLKGCLWAPDGSCLLTSSNDNVLRLFNTPAELDDPPPSWQPVLSMKEAELIYDYAWYPLMDSADSASSWLVSSCRDHPVHAWDAFTGELKASYRNYDQFDAVTACFSLAFSLDSRELFCGLDSSLHIFDVTRPGRQYAKRNTWKRGTGCRGCLSAIAAVDHGLVACGAYNGNACVMDLRSGQAEHSFRHARGVTDLVCGDDGYTLIVGLRATGDVLHYDLRNPSTRVHCFQRALTTNQRLHLSLAPNQRYLLSGDQLGNVLAFDLWANRDDPTATSASESCAFSTTSVNGVACHPHLDWLAVATGQRVIGGGREVADNSDDDDTSDIDAANSDLDCVANRLMLLTRPKPASTGLGIA